jgi:hypothetical protein
LFEQGCLNGEMWLSEGWAVGQNAKENKECCMMFVGQIEKKVQHVKHPIGHVEKRRRTKNEAVW